MKKTVSDRALFGGRQWLAVMCMAVLFTAASASELQAAECVKYDKNGSYVDRDTKHLILRFRNTCAEARTLRIWYNGNYFGPVGGTVPGKGVVDIDVGVRGANDPPFYFTDDGSDPRPRNP